MRMLDDEDSNDVEVSWTDQQKINQFSRLNQRLTDAQSLLETLRAEKEQVDEVFEEVQLLELSEDFDDEAELDDDDDEGDDDEKTNKEGATTTGGGTTLIPFKIGDAFAHVTLEKATTLLEQERSRLERAIDEQHERVSACEDDMKSLKVDLYAKFGNNINLERD